MTDSTPRPPARPARRLAALSLTLLLGACADQGGGSPSPTASGAPMAATASPEAAAKATPGCDHGSAERPCDKHDGNHPGCQDEPSTDGVRDEARERVDGSGHKVTVVGADLGTAETLTVEQALSKPAAEANKTFQVEGNVTAMCEGKRAWFAVVGESRTGETLRVVTTPAFLVPLGSIGRRARVEGRLEQVEISAATAKHYADDHKLPKAGDGSGPVTQTVLRAVGAEFYDP